MVPFNPSGSMGRIRSANVPAPALFRAAQVADWGPIPSLAPSARPIELRLGRSTCSPVGQRAGAKPSRQRAASAPGELAKCVSLDCRPPAPCARLGARHRAGRQLRDVGRDLTWLGQPDLVPVAEDVLQSTSELPQPEWLAQDKGVQHERADQ
jgi:hypothetical protein